MIYIQVDGLEFELPEDLPYSIIEEQAVRKQLWELYPDGQKVLKLTDKEDLNEEIILEVLFNKPTK